MKVIVLNGPKTDLGRAERDFIPEHRKHGKAHIKPASANEYSWPLPTMM